MCTHSFADIWAESLTNVQQDMFDIVKPLGHVLFGDEQSTLDMMGCIEEVMRTDSGKENFGGRSKSVLAPIQAPDIRPKSDLPTL